MGVKKQTITLRSPYREDESSYLALKAKGAKSHKFLQLAGLKAWNLKKKKKISKVCSRRVGRALGSGVPAHEETAGQITHGDTAL